MYDPKDYLEGAVDSSDTTRR